MLTRGLIGEVVSIEEQPPRLALNRLPVCRDIDQIVAIGGQFERRQMLISGADMAQFKLGAIGSGLPANLARDGIGWDAGRRPCVRIAAYQIGAELNLQAAVTIGPKIVACI